MIKPPGSDVFGLIDPDDQPEGDHDWLHKPPLRRVVETLDERRAWDVLAGTAPPPAPARGASDRRPKVHVGVLVPGRLAGADERPKGRASEIGKALVFVETNGIPHRLTYARGVIDENGQRACSRCGKIKAVTIDGALHKHKLDGRECDGAPVGEPIPVEISSLLLKGDGWGILTESGKLRRAMLDGRFADVADVRARLVQLASS